eukprot:CAMPEP_0170645462 /NCGR_PEP_ID=MMETSP0224-20130122/43099_1 /TAXON_ID=285029 /ORGANISM="Togula jolla, Strain CCCM 725" /LENGTH=321 /DNA_ID=CAMNT_0010976693 /DNA_START=118 /DNA_END=1081 /DNA_ORIENTATION=-
MVKRKRIVGKKAKVADKVVEDAGAVSSDAEPSGDEKASEEEDDFFESPDEKRVRLAKEYLRTLEQSKPADEVREQLASDVREQERRTRAQVVKAVTSICISADDRTVYSGGKDCRVFRWDVETGVKEGFRGARLDFDAGGHFEQVRGVCLLERYQLLVSVGMDRLVRLWDPRAPPNSSCVAALHGHTGSVNAVAADPDSSQVYTASSDKSMKIWDMSSRRCVDTLLGHVAGVSAMDIYHKGRPLTGGADKTVRLWKVDKDTHLIFNKHTYPVDAVAVADHDRFVSGSQDGSLSLWSNASKKPLASASLGSRHWVTALGAIR